MAAPEALALARRPAGLGSGRLVDTWRRGPGPHFIPAPLRSVLVANYGVDPRSTSAAAVNINLVNDVIRDQTATPGVDRQATLSSVLQTPVATITPQPTPTIASPSPTASGTPPATWTATSDR